MVQVLFPSKPHLTRVKSEKNDGKLRGTARNLLVVHVMFFAHQNPLRFCTFPRESLGERLLDPWSPQTWLPGLCFQALFGEEIDICGILFGVGALGIGFCGQGVKALGNPLGGTLGIETNQKRTWDSTSTS